MEGGRQEWLQREVEHRLIQQSLLAQLGLFAVQQQGLQPILDEAARLTALGLHTEFSKILQAQPDASALPVVAGVGWRPGVVGHATIPAGLDSPAGYALHTGEPVVSKHVERETRFRFPKLLIEHGVTRAINVIIRGEHGPFGVLEVDSSRDSEFSEHDIAFLQTAANVLAAAIVRQRAETMLREDRERIRLALEAGNLGAWQIDLPSWRMTTTDLCKTIFGRTCEEASLSYEALIAAVHPDDRGRLLAAITHTLASGADYDLEARITGPDGVARMIHWRGRALLDHRGTAVCLLGVVLDVTERTAAAAELEQHKHHLEELVAARTRELAASEAERRQAQEALHQAQKMEVVGQMTGGLAHDFNNLLTVIVGNLDLMNETPAPSADFKRMIASAQRAAGRGVQLTRQLLAFGRRQALRPEVIDVNRLIIEIESLIRRAAGDLVNVVLRFDRPSLPCELDPGQFEAALLNLTVNSRDAMPNGGSLTIETREIELDASYTAIDPDVVPGAYVLVAVGDTGSGMSTEVLEHAYEPFFTTKEVGKGTGLGLSQVYGFVKQSGGHMKLYSEPGHGTVVRIYLPRSDTALPAVGRASGTAVAEVAGTETILVVDDDPDVLDIAVNSLGSLGYAVLIARDGPQALTVLHNDTRIDLLFTDVVMPGGMTGIDLARKAVALRPALRILLTSGYTAHNLAAAHNLGTRFRLMPKPYRRQDLAGMIRELLDQPA